MYNSTPGGSKILMEDPKLSDYWEKYNKGFKGEEWAKYFLVGSSPSGTRPTIRSEVV